VRFPCSPVELDEQQSFRPLLPHAGARRAARGGADRASSERRRRDRWILPADVARLCSRLASLAWIWPCPSAINQTGYRAAAPPGSATIGLHPGAA